MVKGTRMDLSSYEDPEAYDRLQRALRESGGGTAFEVFEEMLRTLTSLASLVMVSSVLFSWNAWLAVVILLAPVPALAAHIVFSKEGYAVEYHRAQDRRRAFYYQDLTTTDSSYKEVKLYQLGPYLVDRYRALVQEFFRVDRGLARRRHGWSAVLGLVSVAGSAGALVFALKSTASTGRLGELAGYLQALGAVHVAAGGLLLGVATLYQNTLFTGNLFDYLSLPEGASPAAPGRSRDASPTASSSRTSPSTTRAPRPSPWTASAASSPPAPAARSSARTAPARARSSSC